MQRYARALRFLVLVAVPALVFASCACAAPPEDTAGIIAAFAAERDILITDPKATADDYRALQIRYAARIPLEMLTATELAQSVAAGICDFPEGRARAAARLSALPDEALTAAIRLTLDGAVTLDQTPDPSRQKVLLDALLARSDLPELMRSANARYAVNALCGVGRSAALSERGADIAAAIARLDPAQSPEIAADAGRVSLLLTLALPDPAPRRVALEKLLAFCQAASPLPLTPSPSEGRGGINAEEMKSPPVPPLPSEEVRGRGRIQQQILRLQDVLRQTAGEKGTAPGRFTLPTIYDMLRADAPPSEPLTARARFYPSDECLLPLSEDALHPRRDTKTAARNAVIAPLGENGLRAFGGVAVRDNLFGFTADDIGILPETHNGFVKNALIKFGPYDLRADFLRFGDQGTGEITNAGFYGLYRGRGWTKLETSRISLDTNREVKIEGVRLSLLNIRLLTIKELKTRLPELKPEDAAPKTSSGPKGQSPITQLLVLPTVGFESGGLTVGYGNAFKFARRLTVPFHFRFYAKDATSFDIGLNYNFLKITNNTDRFTEADYLQEKYLGSYYFDALNDAPLDENERLFVPSLFAGVYTARNQYYVDKDSIRRAINIPFKAAVEGSGGVGNLFGGRFQLSRERVTDEGQGADARWQLMGIVGPPSVRVFRGTHLFLRGDGITRDGERGTYTWLRGLAGVTTRLTPEFRLSAAYINSIERGKPQFTYDEVPADTGYALRGDFALGTIRLYAMDQYSRKERRWVRFQVYLSEVIGVLEPYIRVDQRFGSVSIGLRTPIDAFLDQFLRRRYTRIE